MQNYVIGLLHENDLHEHVYLFIINRGYDTGRDVVRGCGGCEMEINYFSKKNCNIVAKSIGMRTNTGKIHDPQQQHHEHSVRATVMPTLHLNERRPDLLIIHVWFGLSALNVASLHDLLLYKISIIIIIMLRNFSIVFYICIHTSWLWLWLFFILGHWKNYQNAKKAKKRITNEIK